MPRILVPETNRGGAQHAVTIQRFRGVDLSSNAINVDPARSPEAPNMMPDEAGYPTKRTGWEVAAVYDGKVNGIFFLGAKMLIHAGAVLYDDGTTPLFSTMADAKSHAVPLNGKLWIVDGVNYLCYDGTTVTVVKDTATVPVISISRAPNGQSGSTSMYPINLLTGKRTEKFIGNATDKDYFLSFGTLTAFAVVAKKLDSNGVWQTLSEGADFTVDRTVGKVSFSVIPGVPPVTGEDNVQITYETVANGASFVEKNTFGILYGVKGALDRIFLAGNPDEPNIDRWCEKSDPAYFPDLAYSVVGQKNSPIMGYSVLNDMLVAHKNGEENGSNVFVRKGELDTNNFAVFPQVNCIQGEGALSKECIATVAGEPVFLTARGVYALTPSDVTGERYAQNRSYYVNAKLLMEPNIDKAIACVWKKYFILCVNGGAYVLDSEQKQYERGAPYSSYQYECYTWNNIPARVMEANGNDLWFGTEEGFLCKFKKDHRAGAMNDNGKPIVASWTTPLLHLGSFAHFKTVTGVWAAFQPFNKSSGEIWYATDRTAGVFTRTFTASIFDWNDIDFNDFNFNSMDRPLIVAAKKQSKKVKLFQVKLENDKDEPFGIYAIQMHYKQGGKIKK